MDFKLPDIGEGIHEGEVVKWLVKEGDVVKEDQPLLQVMTDKATVEIPAPRSGKIAKIHAPEGKSALVGSVLVTIDEGAGAPAAKPAPAPAAAAKPAAAAPAAAKPAPAAPAAAAKSTNGPAVHATPAPRPAAAPAAAARETATATAAPASGARIVNGKVLAAPATRRMAREMGVEIALVTGSGPNGRVTREDVKAFSGGDVPSTVAATSHGAATAPAGASAADERIPLRGLRKVIAEAMHRSKSTAAHYTYVEEVDVTDLVAFRTGAKAAAEAKGARLTYLPFIIKAVVAALKEFPYVNASLDDAAGEIILKKSYHIGVATMTDDGLLVPVLRDCDRKGLLTIARELDDLANRTRARRATRDELRGSTFTITSLGSLGGLFATPVINHPEVAILGVHKILKRPWVVKDQIVPRDIMLLSLSLDHRVVDGAVGAEFMSRVVEILQSPMLLLLE